MFIKSSGFVVRLRGIGRLVSALFSLEWFELELVFTRVMCLKPSANFPAYINWVWLFCGLWVCHRGTERWPCCPHMSKPSTSSWTARPDGSEWWDKRMASQYLPRDLVLSSSGLKELVQMKKQLLLIGNRFHVTLCILGFTIFATRILKEKSFTASLAYAMNLTNYHNLFLTTIAFPYWTLSWKPTHSTGGKPTCSWLSTYFWRTANLTKHKL